MNLKVIWVEWLATRAIALAMLSTVELMPLSGVTKFFTAAFTHPDPLDQAQAYPLAALAVVWVPYALMGSFKVLLVVEWVIADALFFWWLQERGSRTASRFWVIALPVLGLSVVYTGFDLLPSCLLGLAFWYVNRRPALAGALLAVAVAVKIWPVLVLPALLAMTRRQRPFGYTFLGTSGLLALLTVAVGGWERLLVPFIVQRDRGVVIGSLMATPTMVGRVFEPERWHFELFVSAVEVRGPWVHGLQSVSSLAMALVLGATCTAAWVAYRRGVAHLPHVQVWLLLAPIVSWIATGKVLSPQYLAWLFPIIAISLIVADSPTLRRWSLVVLVDAALTHAVYPWSFKSFVVDPTNPFPVAVLVVRNLLLIALAVWAWREVYRHVVVAQRRQVSALCRMTP